MTTPVLIIVWTLVFSGLNKCMIDDRLRHFFSLLPLDLDLKLDIFDIYYSSPSSEQSELLHQDWPSLFKLPQGCEVVDVKHK